MSGYHLIRVIRRFGADSGAQRRLAQDREKMDAAAPEEGASPAEGSGSRSGAAQVMARRALFEQLGESARLTVVSAAPGNGKTVLLRSLFECAQRWSSSVDTTP